MEPFWVVPQGEAFVVFGPDGKLKYFEFATKEIAEDFVVCMRYAYFLGKGDGIREVAAEIKEALSPNVVSIAR